MLLVVGGKVLRGRHRLEVFGVLSLDPAHKGCAVFTGKVRVLAVGLRRPSPAGIPRKVQVRAPEGQKTVVKPLIGLAAVFLPLAVKILRAGFRRDRVRDLLQKNVVKHRAQGDGLREHCEFSGPHHAVQRLVAVVVFRDAEPVHRFGKL